MKKLAYQITAYQCRIELTKKQFDKLESIDYLNVVMPKLEKLGASNIEYNGHFGEAIFFITDTLEEAQKITEEIEKMLK